MEVDECDRIVLGGWFYGELDFEGTADIIDSGHGNAKDAFLAKLDADGQGVWAYGFGDNETGDGTGQAINRVGVNADGTIAAAGSFYGTIDLGGGDIDCATCATNGQTDEFVGAFSR